MSFEFNQEGTEFFAYISRDQIPVGMSYEVMKCGGVYSGSSVLAMLFPGSFEPSDIDCYISNGENHQSFIMCAALSKDYPVSNIILPDNEEYESIYYLKSILECTILSPTSIKCQFITTRLERSEIVTNLHKLFDLDRCATRLYIDDNNRICLRVPINSEENSPYSRVMKWNTDAVKNYTKSIQRMNKYISRGFAVEPFPFYCVICSNPTLERSECCNNYMHTCCVKKWSTCEEGNELTQKMIQCPSCTKWLTSSIAYVRFWDFDKYKYIRCIVCRNYYRRERNTCAETETHDPSVSICDPCMKLMDPNIIYKGQKYKCPKCGLISEFKGGCQMLTCCLYGPEKCKFNCTHGSTDSIIFCGHKWKFQMSNLVL